MAHFKKLTNERKADKIIYGDNIVDGIVLLAIGELPYVEICSSNIYNKLHSKSIKVKFTKEGLVIDVDVKIHFSQSVSNMAFKIQESIRHNVESMTDYHLSAVNVFVKGVSFEEVKVNTENKAEENDNQTTNQLEINDKITTIDDELNKK